MERRQFTREFKLEAVRLTKQRGVSYASIALVLAPLKRRFHKLHYANLNPILTQLSRRGAKTC